MPGWPVVVGPSFHTFIPTVADVYGDATPEIIVPAGVVGEGPRAYLANGQLVPSWAPPDEFSFRVLAGRLANGPHESPVLTTSSGSVDAFVALGADGSVLPGWPALDAVLGADALLMALGDLTGDGHDELVYLDPHGPDLSVHAIGADGQTIPGWPVALDWPSGAGNPTSFVGSSLAIGDVDLDGRSEVVVLYYGGQSNPVPVWLLDGAGSVRPGWPLLPHPGGLYHSAVIADINQDFEPEIVLVGYIRLVAYRPDGTRRCEVASPPVAYRFPAVGDLDGDGWLEVVLAGDRLSVAKLHQFAPVTLGFVIVAVTSDSLPNRTYGPPVLGDVNGDGQAEIVAWSVAGPGATYLWTLHVLDSQTLVPLPGWPKVFPTGVSTPYRDQYVPALADLDGDGDMEIIHTVDHEVYVWNQPAIGNQGQPAPWPMLMHDATGGGSFHRGREPSPRFVRGDSNGDSFVNVADVPYLLRHLYFAESVSCEAAVDVDAGGTVDLADAMLLLTALFDTSFLPPAPYPACGEHPAVTLGQCYRFVCP